MGRREELAALQAALAQAQDGVGALALIAGDAGLGKSRLIAELAAGAERDGMTVMIGECLPLGDGELPYAPIMAALRSLLRHGDEERVDAWLSSGRSELAALLPELARPGDRTGLPAGSALPGAPVRTAAGRASSSSERGPADARDRGLSLGRSLDP